MITKFVKVAIKDIFANKARSFLTVLGILIGISSVTLMVSIGGSAQKYINDSITSQLGKNMVIVQPGKQSSGSGGFSFSFSAILSSLSDKEYDALKALDSQDIQDVARRQISSVKVSYAKTEEEALMFIIDPAYFKIIDIKLVEGRYLRNNSGARDVIIGQGLAKSLFKLQSPLNRKVSINGVEFNIVGEVEDVAGTALGSSSMELYMDTNVYRTAFNKPDRVNALIVGINPQKTFQEVEPKMTKALRASRDLLPSEESDFSLTSQEDIVKTSEDILGVVTMFITIIAAISLLVGGIGVMNIMLVSVRERVKEIGLRKAIGATNQDIQLQILIESVLFSLIGGILGIVLGGAGALVIEKVGGLPPYISPNAIYASLGVSSFVGIVFGLYPAIQAGKLSPIEALRSN